MRLGNWDVILLPSDSGTPLSEFEVKAYSIDDTESMPLESAFVFADAESAANGAAVPMTPESSSNGAAPPPFLQVHAQMPLVCGFVPSLPTGTSFRVSVYCWGEKIACGIDRALIDAPEKVPCCEVRVFIDGLVVGSGVIKPDIFWPLMIGTSYGKSKLSVSSVDGKANDTAAVNPVLTQGFLRWPDFHEDQLSDTFWNHDDACGRIKIVITEGILNQMTGEITRMQNVAAFAFQHAPLEILKAANIAWPNASLPWKPEVVTRNNAGKTNNKAVKTKNNAGNTTQMSMDSVSNAARNAARNTAAQILPQVAESPWTLPDGVNNLMVNEPQFTTATSPYAPFGQMSNPTPASNPGFGSFQAQPSPTMAYGSGNGFLSGSPSTNNRVITSTPMPSPLKTVAERPPPRKKQAMQSKSKTSPLATAPALIAPRVDTASAATTASKATAIKQAAATSAPKKTPVKRARAPAARGGKQQATPARGKGAGVEGKKDEAKEDQAEKAADGEGGKDAGNVDAEQDE